MKILIGITQAILFLHSVIGQTTPRTVNTTGCITGPSTLYIGKQNMTYTGIPCQRWDSNVPHKPRRIPIDGTNHNYCRNPDNDPAGTWCYTTNPKIRWQFCHIPKCPDSSLLFMATRVSNHAKLQHVPADVELSFPNWNPQVVHNQTDSQFWSLAADKHGERIFFTDIRTDNLGVFSLATSNVEKKMVGMMKDVEQLAYDWITGNLYFNDYKKKWIMAVDKNFQYYTVVYRNIDESFYGLALHARQRLLFFTVTTKAGLTQIKSSDLAGQNQRKIYPEQQTRPSTIRTLAVDYTDDKLYWAVEYPGFLSLIKSCNFDGSNVTLIYSVTQRTVWGVAAYWDFVYLAEHTQYYSSLTGSISYRLRVITKRGGPFRTVRSPSRIRGLAVYSDREEFSEDFSGLNETLEQLGNCSSLPKCSQICLPRLNARRMCGCLPGFFKFGDTECNTRNIIDNFMLLFDKPQKRLFKVSLSDSNHSFTAIDTDLRYRADITALAINPLSGEFFWYSKNASRMYMRTSSGNVRSFRTKLHVTSMAVEPLSGNIYYSDGDTQTINVINPTGLLEKNLTSPPGENSTVNLGTIALDIVNKHVYWIATATQGAEAQLWRMGMDGSNQTMLLQNLISAKHIFIDVQRQSLFITVVDDSAGGTPDILYEIPLKALAVATGRIPGQSKRYNIQFSFNSDRFVQEFVTVGSTFYFTTYPTNGLQSINLTEATTQASSSGNVVEEKSFFYAPSLMSVFLPSQRRILESLPNACGSRIPSCQHFCVLTPQNSSACTCENGYVAAGTTCRNSSVPIDAPPSYGNTCPTDFQVSYLHCQSAPRVSWTPPTWSDDITDSAQLVVHASHTVGRMLSRGVHSILYTARDSSGNIGYCAFKITVSRLNCRLIPPRREDNVTFAQGPQCVNGTAFVEVICKRPNKVIQYGNTIFNSFINTCQPSLQYELTEYSVLKCVNRSTVTTPATTPIATTTTTLSPRTINPIPAYSTTPSTLVVSTATKSTSISGKQDQPSTSTGSNFVNNPGIPARGRKNKHLSTGATVAIVLVALVVVVILVGVIYMRARRKNSGFGRQNDGSPIFSWNKSGDKEVANESVYHHL